MYVLKYLVILLTISQSIQVIYSSFWVIIKQFYLESQSGVDAKGP